MTLTQTQSRDALRRAVGLLEGAPVLSSVGQWRQHRDAFLADLASLLGVGTEGIGEALTPKPGRGRDQKPRKIGSGRPGVKRVAENKSVDKFSAPVVASQPSRLDCSDPPARSNDDATDVDQIAATHTVTALRFQQMSL